ncbi:MAG: GerW family sporulation protein [Chloroflexota bacterium]
MATDVSAAIDEARAAAEGGLSDRIVDRLMERIAGKGGAEAVFGEPVERGDVAVIPVARVRWGIGYGGGTAPETAGPSAGSGSGGGGGVMADPVGYIEVGPDGATFQPIVSPYPSPVFLLALGVTAAVVIRAVARLVRG